MIELTRRETYLLEIIFEIGPTSNREIAMAAGMKPARCYPFLYRMRQKGLLEPHQYELSALGLRIRRRAKSPRKPDRTLF